MCQTTLKGNIVGHGPVFTHCAPPPKSPPIPLKDCRSVPNALFTLEQVMVPIPFAWAEVALHAFINNKCEAQRVGTGKSKYEGKPSHTARKSTRLFNLGMVKHCSCKWVTHEELNARWQNADKGNSKVEQATKEKQNLHLWRHLGKSPLC